MRKTLLLFCLLCAALCLTAAGLDLSVVLHRGTDGKVVSAADTARTEKSTQKSLSQIADSARHLSLPPDFATLLSDSAKTDTTAPRLPLPTVRSASSDSTANDTAAVDSVVTDSVKPRKPGIDSPVEYVAEDSMVYDAATGLVHLYGKAQVTYQNMQLDAEEIVMDMDSSMVHACGRKDSTEESGFKGNPVFKQGNDQYDSERMSFNFKTKKGYIKNTYTAQGNGFMQSQRSKRADDGTLYLEHAKYTTCDAKHPHFYIALSRGKVRPGKETIFGPAYLVVEDVPLPLAIPYGFFPINKKYSSGFIMPSFGDETQRGFYLRDGGYYFALNDRMDLKLLGEIYTKGSWGINAESNYKRRYKYSGNLYFSYLYTVEGEKNMPDYAVTKSLKVQWTHTKDPKASPNTTFSARVNFASENYERKNLSSMYDPLAYTQSTRASSVSFSRTFPNIGLTISSSANLTQNMRDSSVAVTLPDLSISLSRLYPFRRKKQVGKERWYEKISLSYTGQLSNSITTKEDQLFKSNLVKDWRNGMQHRIPIDATFQLFKYINISPTFTFRDIMYAQRINRSWDRDEQREVRDTTYGFYNLYDWSLGVSVNTTLYGFYKPWKPLFGSKVLAFRHVFKPSVSFTYAPDFTTSRYGYTRQYEMIDAEGNSTWVQYSPYQNGLYGYPSGTRQGMISMSVSNNLEMKVKSDRDSTGMKKISLIDELSATLSYNTAAKIRPWSNLNMRLRLKLTPKYTFSMAAVFATYAYKFDETGRVVTSERTEWSYGRFGRFQGMSQNLSYTLNNQSFSKLLNLFRGKKKHDTSTETDDTSDETTSLEDANVDPDLIQARKSGKKKKEKATLDADGYLAFSMPWSLTLSYGITMAEDRNRQINVRTMRYPYSFSQTLNASGYLQIADGWNISFSSGYDFDYHELSMTTLSVARDLHCFEMSAQIVLKPYSSFNFTFRARASELADALKWEKRSSFSTNVEWY